ncbi:MAG: response regulator [Bacilli bacterium]
MSINLYFPLSGLFFILFMLGLYFSKKRLITIENKLYRKLLVISLITLLLNILVIAFNNNSFFMIIFFKLNLISILVWFMLLTFLLQVLTLKKKERTNDYFSNLFKRSLFWIISFGLISSLILLVLPIKKTNYLEGYSLYFLYLIITFLMITWFIRYLKRNKRIKRKQNSILLIVFFLVFLITLGQIFYPEFFSLLLIIYLIPVVIYFWLDNFDLELLNKLKEEKERANLAETTKIDLLLKATHEIRTPLNTILGFSQSMIDETSLESIKEDAKQIKEASKKLLHVIDNILDVYKPEHEEISFVYSEYNINNLFKQITSLIESKLKKEVEFKLEIRKEIPSVLYGDSIVIKKILLNLLEHSVKYTKEGYIKLKIDNLTIGNICRLKIRIEDSGRGISVDELEKIFLEKRIDEKRLKEGEVDLNLATTKRLIELMNGQFIVESEYNDGTVYKISLDQKTLKPEEKEEQPLTEINYKEFIGKKILVVDDDPLNYKVVSKLLKDYQLIIDSVSSGRKCLEKINNQEEYDLILLDDRMPNMSGVETLKELEKDKKFNIPVIALTANVSYGIKEKYLQEGFDDYIPKPIEKKVLEKVIKKYLSMEIR